MDHLLIQVLFLNLLLIRLRWLMSLVLIFYIPFFQDLPLIIFYRNFVQDNLILFFCRVRLLLNANVFPPISSLFWILRRHFLVLILLSYYLALVSALIYQL